MTDETPDPKDRPGTTKPDAAPAPIEIIDLLGIITASRPARTAPKPPEQTEPRRPCEPIRPGFRGVFPVAAGEQRYFDPMPTSGPVYRSAAAAELAQHDSARAARIKVFSFDPIVDLTHTIARFERAGLGHLVADARLELDRKIAEDRAFAAREPERHAEINRHFGDHRDATSEQLMTKLYGSAEEDRARLSRHFTRLAHADTAIRRGLPRSAPGDLTCG